MRIGGDGGLPPSLVPHVEGLIADSLVVASLGAAFNRLHRGIEKAKKGWSPLAEPGKYVPVEREVVRRGKVFRQRFYRRVAGEPEKIPVEGLHALADTAGDVLREVAREYEEDAEAYGWGMHEAWKTLYKSNAYLGEKVSQLLGALAERRVQKLSDEEKDALHRLARLCWDKMVERKAEPAEETFSSLMRFCGNILTFGFLMRVMQDPKLRERGGDAVRRLAEASRSIALLRHEAQKVAATGFRDSTLFDEEGKLRDPDWVEKTADAMGGAITELVKLGYESCPEEVKSALGDLWQEYFKKREEVDTPLLRWALKGEVARIQLLCPEEHSPYSQQEREEIGELYGECRRKVGDLVYSRKVSTWNFTEKFMQILSGHLPEEERKVVWRFLDLERGLGILQRERWGSAYLWDEVWEVVRRGYFGFALHIILGGREGIPKAAAYLERINSLLEHVDKELRQRRTPDSVGLNRLLYGAAWEEYEKEHDETFGYLTGLGLREDVARVYADWAHTPSSLKYRAMMHAGWAETLRKALAGEQVPTEQVVDALTGVALYRRSFGY